jgi:hypothetical protein
VLDSFANKSDEERAAARVWNDVFVEDQNSSTAKPKEYWYGAFQDAIKHIGSTLFVLAPWHAPIAITRSWCIWEVFSSLRCDAQEQQSLCGANAWDEYGSGTSATWLSTHRKRTKGVLGSLLDQEKLLRLEQHAVELLDRAHHATAARVGAGILPDAPPPPAVSTESESAAATSLASECGATRSHWGAAAPIVVVLTLGTS